MAGQITVCFVAGNYFIDKILQIRVFKCVFFIILAHFYLSEINKQCLILSVGLEDLIIRNKIEKKSLQHTYK